MSININELIKNNPVFLAPMSGVTDLPFRTQVQKYGNNLVYSEMNASSEMVHLLKIKSKFFGMNLLTVKVDQLLSNRWMGSTNNVDCCISSRGTRAQIIDINMGCPAKKLLKGMLGPL